MRKLLVAALMAWAPLTYAQSPAVIADQPAFLPTWPVDLQTDVARVQRGFRGQFALVVKDLSTGVRYGYNDDTPMYLASGIKIPVMVALFHEVHVGRIQLDDELILRPENVRDGAPLLNYLRQGTPVTLRILLEAMIQQSDNAATDMIIDHLGVKKVNDILAQEGFEGFGPITTLIDVRRLVYRHLDPRTAGLTPRDIFRLRVTKPLEARLDLLAQMLDEPAGTFTVGQLDRAYRAYYRQGYNSAPVERMAALLEAIVAGKVVSPEASKAMLEVLLGTQTGARRIRGGVGFEMPLAHKTGTQYRRTCDFGVFFMTPTRPVVFAIAVKGGKRKAAEGVMSKLAKRALFHLTHSTPSSNIEEELAAGDESPLPPDEMELLDPESRAADKKPKKKRRKARKKKRATAPKLDPDAL